MSPVHSGSESFSPGRETENNQRTLSLCHDEENISPQNTHHKKPRRETIYGENEQRPSAVPPPPLDLDAFGHRTASTSTGSDSSAPQSYAPTVNVEAPRPGENAHGLDVEEHFGTGAYECIFKFREPQPNNPCALLCGIYPPADSSPDQPLDNLTSKGVATIFGDEFFDWNDLLPFAPLNNLKDVKLDSLQALFNKKDPSLKPFIDAFWDRTIEWIDTQYREGGHHRPTVVWVGIIPNLARQWIWAEHNFNEEAIVKDVLFEIRTVSFKSQTNERVTFTSVEDVVHPSHALQSHGEQSARHRRDDSYQLISVMRGKIIEELCDLQ